MISVAAWVWAAFALAALPPFTRTQSVAVPAAPSSWPDELMTAAFETAHAPPFTGRFVRSVARLVTSDSACVCAGRSPASSVSHAGSADTVPVPVWRRNFRVAVVLPATRAQAGVALAAIRSPRTGEAAAVSGCVALREVVGGRHRTHAATVTFTRSLPASSATVSVTFAPSIRFNARRVPTAVPAFWIVNGSDPETMSVATWVWAGRSPETNVVPPVTRPLCVHGDLRVCACHHAVSANESNPCRHRQPADRIDLDDALAGGRGVRIRERAEGLARREVDDGVHRHVVAGVQRHPEVARVVGLAPLDRAEVGQAHQAGGGFVSGPELRAVLERLQAGDRDRAVLQNVVARRRRAELVLDGQDRRLERGDEAGDHVGLHLRRRCGGWRRSSRTPRAGSR